VAIGSMQSVTQLNGLLTSLVSQANKLCLSITTLQDYCTSVGASGLEGLTNPFTSADATNFIDAVSYLNTWALIWQGAATQATEYNFQNQLAELTGPTPTM
jgi:hypothetical protein